MRTDARAWALPAWLAALLSCAFVAVPATAQQESRVALVISNAIYSSQVALKNPHNDGDDVAAALARTGFTVTRRKDLTRAAMAEAVDDFRRAAQAADVALVYYAGHGIEVGQNYLLPVDARMENAEDAEAEGIRLDSLRQAVAVTRKRVGIVIIDACRNNPFLSSLRNRPGQPALSPGIGPVRDLIGTVIGFAAEPGVVALDDNRDGRNSPYTAGLLRHLEEPGLELNAFFTKVSNTVLAETGGRQYPYAVSAGLGAPFFFKPAAGALDERELFARLIEDQYWNAVKASTNAEDLRGYLRSYPNGRYARQAQETIARLAGPAAVQPDPPRGAPPPPAPPPPVAQPGPAERAEVALALSDDDRLRVQAGLNALGFAVGTPDGRFGPRTRSAIERWQAAAGEPQTGYLSRRQVEELAQGLPVKAPLATPPPRVAALPVAPVTRPPRILTPLPQPSPAAGRRSGQGDAITQAETRVALAERLRGSWCAEEGTETLAVTTESAPEIRVAAPRPDAPAASTTFRIAGYVIFPEHVAVSVTGAGGQADEWVFFAPETRGNRIVLMRAGLIADLLWQDYGRPFLRCS